MAILRKDLPEMEKGAQSLRDLIVGHQQKLEQDQQKSALDVSAKKQEQNNAIDAVQKMSDSGMVNEGGSVTVNGVGYGKGYDPNKVLGAQNRLSDQAIKDATSAYNKGLPKIQDQFNAASEGLQFTNDPKNIGSLGQARTLALKSMGMNRYNEQEAKAVVPPALQGVVSQMFNSAGGDETPLNESQKRSMNMFFKAAAEQAHQKHGLLMSNTLGGYQQRNGYDPNKAEGLKNSVMHNFEQQYDDKMKGFANLPTTTSPESARPAPTGTIDKLREFLSGGPSAPAQSAPQPAMADAVAAEMARRKKK